MSANVFYYLKINEKYVSLTDLDEVLCQLLGVAVSEDKYMIPEGNTVNWVDMLASLLFNLPASVRTNDVVDFNDVIEAVCHYNTDYAIQNVESYIRCFNLIKRIGVVCVVHYANLSMFDDKERNYYDHIHDNDDWMTKQDLQTFMKMVDISDEIKMSHETILRRLYYQSINVNHFYPIKR